MKNLQENADVDPLFSTPIYKTILNFNDNDWELIQKNIKNFDYEKYYLNGSSNGQGTIDQKVLTHSNFKILKEKIDNHLNNFVFNILKIQNTKFSHSNSWINKHLFGDFSPTHWHSFSVFSGIFYLNIPMGDSGNIKFYPQHHILSTETFNFSISEYNIFNSKSWEYSPENKLLLIFPSYLCHSVSQNNTNEERYSLAFNYFVEGELGYKTQKLNLKVI